MKLSGGGVRAVSVSREAAAFKRAAAEYVKKATASSKAANNTLTQIGTHTAKGELTEKYRR